MFIVGSFVIPKSWNKTIDIQQENGYFLDNEYHSMIIMK